MTRLHYRPFGQRRGILLRPSFLVAVCSLLLLAACSSGSTKPEQAATVPVQASPTAEATSPGATPAAAASPTPHAIPGVEFPPDQSQTLSDLIEQTAQIRGLAPKAGIARRLIGRQAAADYLESTLDPGDQALLALKQDLYRTLGLIPDDADLLKLQISLLRALVLGFYDPDVKVLFVLSDLGINSTVTRLTIVHEVTHALQDQYYDLNAIDLSIRDDWDKSFAFTDLVEGDARGVETAFVNPSLANSTSQACDDSSFIVNRNSNVPVVIQRELQAPYSDGRCFIVNVRPSLAQGVDSIFADLPESTEQVLHPQKYLAGEDPQKVALQPLQDRLGAGWKQIGSSTMGEFGLQNLLLLGVTDLSTVKRGAAGWGGDRWALYGRDDGARLVHLATAWDSEPEAREFWQVFVRSLNGRAGGSPVADEGLNFVSWEQGGKTVRARLSGTNVTVVISTDAAAAQTAAAALGIG